MEVLRVGDTVEWRGSWGQGIPRLTTVTNIVLAPGGDADGPNTVDVEAVPWGVVEGREVVVDLASGNWAYGFQITRPGEES